MVDYCIWSCTYSAAIMNHAKLLISPADGQEVQQLGQDGVCYCFHAFRSEALLWTGLFLSFLRIFCLKHVKITVLEHFLWNKNGVVVLSHRLFFLFPVCLFVGLIVIFLSVGLCLSVTLFSYLTIVYGLFLLF